MHPEPIMPALDTFPPLQETICSRNFLDTRQLPVIRVRLLPLVRRKGYVCLHNNIASRTRLMLYAHHCDAGCQHAREYHAANSPPLAISLSLHQSTHQLSEIAVPDNI
jgi:hypothetical protein